MAETFETTLRNVWLSQFATIDYVDDEIRVRLLGDREFVRSINPGELPDELINHIDELCKSIWDEARAEFGLNERPKTHEDHA